MATSCVEVWQTAYLRLLRTGEEERKKTKKKIVTTAAKYNGLSIIMVWVAARHRQ